ncbi:alpha/beta hydrolase [Zavarzinella formosa]|uniref:alpha/beta hydrolase n=1 Tax=Zavarzinella formosa TaxID=360055 RepID=UPI000309949C|nr:alpha/beta fold hydrolase [Zavarzinella formosa]
MRLTICLVGLLWAGLASAQTERYVLGKKVHDLELAWETQSPSAEAKKRATPLINKAVQSFFSLNMTGAAKYLDEARHALLSPDSPPAGVKWADAVSVLPESRLLDAKATEWPVAVKLFYKPDGDAPANPVIHVIVGRSRAQEFPIDKLPVTVTVALKDIPGLVTADLPVSVAVVSGGKVLGIKTHTLSRVENLDKRLAKLRGVLDAKSLTHAIEQATLAHLTKLLGDLATKTVPETDYPAAKLIVEAEQLIESKEPFYALGHSGEHWLALPTEKATSFVRIRLPVSMTKESPVPVVFALHGMGGSENMFFDAYGNGIVPRMAFERGWLIVATRVNGMFGPTPNVPAILDQLAERYPIDRKRVFLVGHSMGAGHVTALAQQTPERFTGVAALGGGGKIDKPEAVKDLPFFIGCGKQDIALKGAKQLNDSLTAAKTPVTFKEYEDIEHLAIVQEAAKDVFAFFDKLAAKTK